MSAIQNLHNTDYYDAGTPLTLDLGAARRVTVTVVQHLSSTTSQVFTVKISTDESQRLRLPPSDIFVMKIFDSRFLKHRLEDDHPWNLELETKAREMPAKRSPDGELIHPHHVGTEDPLEWELFYQNTMLDMFNTEKRAYSILRSFQGRNIPRCYASGTLWSPPGERAVSLPILLFGYLDGEPLASFHHDATRITRNVYSSLHRLLRKFKRKGVAHTDIHDHNIHLVSVGRGKYRPFILDFGCSIIREGMTNEEWEEEYDELGDLDALKYVFRRLGFEYGFQPDRGIQNLLRSICDLCKCHPLDSVRCGMVSL